MDDAERRSDLARSRLLELSGKTGQSLMALSEMLGRNSTYLQQFIRRRSPRVLPEDERLLLAQHFGIDERELGAWEPWNP